MELAVHLEALAIKVKKHADIIETEEAAKFAFINPFIEALGFDLSDPSQVVPEFTCDVGGKKGEKVDYALKIGDEVAILVECKATGSDLSLKHASQLYRYYGASEAKFAVLTNGVIYKFFSDLNAANKMDEEPFLEVDLFNLSKSDVRELGKFQREGFDADAAAEAAANMQMQSGVLEVLTREMREPSEKMVQLVASQVVEGRLSPGIKSAIARHIPNAFNAMMRAKLDAKWTSAMEEEPDDEPASASEIETTEEEIEGFNIVRSIGSEVVSPERIVMRDSKSYCAVLLDDNNRKPIARLRFNSATTKHIGLFDADKNEGLEPVESPIDIFQFKALILERIKAMIA